MDIWLGCGWRTRFWSLISLLYKHKGVDFLLQKFTSEVWTDLMVSFKGWLKNLGEWLPSQLYLHLINVQSQVKSISNGSIKKGSIANKSIISRHENKATMDLLYRHRIRVMNQQIQKFSMKIYKSQRSLL